MLKLYSFYWDCGRSGSLDGLFVADESDVESAIGRDVHFGEVLGKRSDVYGTLEVKDLEVVSDDQEKIQWLIDVIGSSDISGFNPLDYCSESEDLDEEE